MQLECISAGSRGDYWLRKIPGIPFLARYIFLSLGNCVFATDVRRATYVLRNHACSTVSYATLDLDMKVGIQSIILGLTGLNSAFLLPLTIAYTAHSITG
jgi:hypothetical protein